MSQTKDIIKHVLVETAAAQRKCYHKPKLHSISKGEACLVVKDTSSRAKRNYCAACASEIIKLGEIKINGMKRSLGIGSSVRKTGSENQNQGSLDI
jgi:hypothetical protein